jgi:hypothetical protein
MNPGSYNFKIYKGGTWSIGIQQSALDFASYDEIRMQIRPPFVRGVPTKPALLELTLENGRITLEDDDTTLRLTISAADTAEFTFDSGIYDLELVTYGDTEIVDKLLYGKISVYGEQTI